MRRQSVSRGVYFSICYGIEDSPVFSIRNFYSVMLSEIQTLNDLDALQNVGMNPRELFVPGKAD